MLDRFQAELEANESYAKLLRQAQAVGHQFQAAGMSLPVRLAQFMGKNDEEISSDRASKGLKFDPPIPPPKPREVPEDAIYVALKEATPTTMVLAVLREKGVPIQPSALAETVAESLKPRSINRGSVLNAIARLEGTAVERTDDGMVLKSTQEAPVILGEYLWSKPSVFQDFERSAFRRHLIVHLLGQIEDGLMAMQIVSELQRWGKRWKDVLVSKDILKADLEHLKARNLVRKIANSRKWTLRQK